MGLLIQDVLTGNVIDCQTLMQVTYFETCASLCMSVYFILLFIYILSDENNFVSNEFAS